MGRFPAEGKSAMEAFKLLERKVEDLCSSKKMSDTIEASEEDKGPLSETWEIRGNLTIFTVALEPVNGGAICQPLRRRIRDWGNDNCPPIIGAGARHGIIEWNGVV